MSILESFWRELSGLSAYELTSSSGEISETHWQGKGMGDVSAEFLAADCCYLKEKGIFSMNNGVELESQNEWLWQRQSDSLTLSHVRRGRDHPVLLFELEEDIEAGMLVTSSPHLCGKDTYKANAWLHDEGLHVDWHISGPAKDERLACRYYR